MKKYVLFAIPVLLVLVVVAALVFFLVINKREDVNPDEAVDTTSVSITSDGFEPATIKIKAGDSVTWTNNDDRTHHVASDPHPIHTDLSGLESDNLSPGDTYTFTFDEAGEFTYHCHLHPGMKGAVVVE